MEKNNEDGIWTVIATVFSNNTSFQDYNLELNIKYYYRILSFNAFGVQSTTTNIDSAIYFE
jgi:hypothetical protein